MTLQSSYGLVIILWLSLKVSFGVTPYGLMVQLAHHAAASYSLTDVQASLRRTKRPQTFLIKINT